MSSPFAGTGSPPASTSEAAQAGLRGAATRITRREDLGEDPHRPAANTCSFDAATDTMAGVCDGEIDAQTWGAVPSYLWRATLTPAGDASE